MLSPCQNENVCKTIKCYLLLCNLIINYIEHMNLQHYLICHHIGVYYLLVPYYYKTDLTCVVNLVCRYMHCPSQIQMQAVKCILPYIHKNYGIHILSQSTIHLYEFFDDNWAGCPYQLLVAACLSDPTACSEMQRNNLQSHNPVQRQNTAL